MKTLHIFLFIVCFPLVFSAQTVVFSEDFESPSSITSLVNIFTGTMPDGPSPCGLATRGNTSNFNSTNIDFLNAQNNTLFLGANPESPCGGYYSTDVHNPVAFDFSSTDSLVFRCRYYKSSTLNWGLTQIQISFSDGTYTQTINPAEFPVTDVWTYYETAMDNDLAGSSSVTMNIAFNCGDGVALDDIEIVNYPTAGIENKNNQNFTIYPNPSGGQFTVFVPELLTNQKYQIVNLIGETIHSDRITQNNTFLDLNLPAGIYFLSITDGNKYTTKKLIIK